MTLPRPHCEGPGRCFSVSGILPLPSNLSLLRSTYQQPLTGYSMHISDSKPAYLASLPRGFASHLLTAELPFSVGKLILYRRYCTVFVTDLNLSSPRMHYFVYPFLWSISLCSLFLVDRHMFSMLEHETFGSVAFNKCRHQLIAFMERFFTPCFAQLQCTTSTIS